MTEVHDEHETALPEEPEGAVSALFGDRADLARAYLRHLATSAVARGLVGPREVPRLWQRHVLNCVSVAELVPDGATLADVGSGAGLPGLAVAIARPDLDVTLVEPLQRRVTWLGEVVEDLGLGNVRIERARAEDLRGILACDVTTARAVAALPVLAGWCLPLTRPGGHLLALKGRTAGEELEASVEVLRSLGAVAWAVHETGAEVLDEPTTVVRVEMGAEVRRPGRSAGRASRRPRRDPGGRRRG